ncbi:MAG: heavy-metal-associated domain-containing protein [Alistipes sp.]|nr:heavy-metal-associated domain-containing protein [Alistipes sp.]
MKKILMFCLVAVMSVGVGFAQEKKAKAEKQIVTTTFCTDIDCEGCAKKVYNSIPFEKGVKDVKVDVKAKTVTVQYDSSKNSDEALVNAFTKIKVKAAPQKK